MTGVTKIAIDLPNHKAIGWSHFYNSRFAKSAMLTAQPNEDEARAFIELRRKVRAAEILSAAVEQLLRKVQFSGKLSVVVQNGRVLKSGYEEGYFRSNGQDG